MLLQKSLDDSRRARVRMAGDSETSEVRIIDIRYHFTDELSFQNFAKHDHIANRYNFPHRRTNKARRGSANHPDRLHQPRCTDIRHRNRSSESSRAEQGNANGKKFYQA